MNITDSSFPVASRRFVHSWSKIQGMIISLNVIYLIGAKFSDIPRMPAQESDYLTRALQCFRHCGDPSRPSQRKIDVMQAEVLLASCLFNQNHRLEGICHTNAAVSIAMASKLYITHWALDCSRNDSSSAYQLSPPADALEGECFGDVRTIFAMNRC